MTRDEEVTRTLLREADIPPSGLEVEELMARGRRSRRRRRVAAAVAAGATLAAVAVTAAGPFVGPPDRETPPEPVADVATTVRVLHRPATVGGGAACAASPLRRLDGDDPGMFPGVFDADASGERTVGSSRGGRAVTLWTRGEPEQFTLPGLATVLTATAVNANGVVVGFSSDQPLVSFRYRDGDLQTLTPPGGYPRVAAAEVNDRGDTLGVAATEESFDVGLALVVWPADAPDRPRVVVDRIPGVDLHPLAIRNDGTVIALHTEIGRPVETAASAVVVHRPDGTRTRIDAPAGIGFGELSATGVVRGDYLFTTWVAAPAGADPKTGPVRWNLRSGLVEIFDNLLPGALTVGNAGGWFVTRQGRFDGPPVLVGPDAKARSLPGATTVGWIGANGSALAGITADGTAVTWRC